MRKRDIRAQRKEKRDQWQEDRDEVLQAIEWQMPDVLPEPDEEWSYYEELNRGYARDRI